MEGQAERSGNPRDIAVLSGTLLLFWVMLADSLAIGTLAVGAAISLGIALLFRSGLSFFTEFRFTPQAIVAGGRYFVYFFQEMVRANLRLASIVLAPDLPIRPGIVKARTRLQSRMGQLMLANSITLTPGTLTVELQGEWMYIHWVTVESEDVDEATARIVAGFEQYLEVMYG